MMVRFHLGVQKKTMNYIQNLERPSKLGEGKNVSFTLSDGTTYNGTVIKGSGFYINLNCVGNDRIFKALGLDKAAFMQDTVGYAPGGNWPETYTLEDLSKVLEALLKVNEPEEPKIEEPEEKKPTPPSEWDWLLS